MWVTRMHMGYMNVCFGVLICVYLTTSPNPQIVNIISAYNVSTFILEVPGVLLVQTCP